ncbi:MAG: nucleotidyltransferase family protein [Clostridia bacterium]|nr:nucleotidyltransferase family protein [Clostridia bacterium]
MILLFSVIRAAFGIDYPETAPTAKECEELLAFGKKQSILPVIYVGLKKTDISADLLKAIDRERNRDLRRFILHNDALQKIEDALNKEQISYIPLKGAVLRNLYPAPEMRTSSDIDVLVHEDDLDRAVRTIESVTDFKADHRAYHDISMLNQSVHLELHFSIKENDENLDKVLSRVWEYTVPTESSRYEFTPEFQMFHVVAHMAYHFLHGGLGIRPFLDLWLLRTKTAYDENKVQALCEQCGILTFYEECCKLIDVWLGDGKHTETTEMLEQFCLSGGVFGSKKFKNAARQRERRGLKYILGRVFPPASQVREYYSNASGEKHGLPYYYVKRWISWAKRGKEMKRQIGEIVSTDQEYIDKTDELFRRLEMT